MKRSETLRLAETARSEAARAMRALRATRPPRAYYLSYLIRESEEYQIRAKFGQIAYDNRTCHRDCFADVRVGSYRFDQIHEGGLHDNSKEDESYEYVSLPLGPAGDGLRHGLWKLTDARYREAVDSFLQKRSQSFTYLNRNEHLASFERRGGRLESGWTKLPPVDAAAWTRYVLRASELPKSLPDILDSYVEFHARSEARIFVNSEGSLLIQCMPYFRLECYLWLLSPKGEAVPWTHVHFVSDLRELPSLGRLRTELRRTYAKMRTIVEAPRLRSFTGPVLLEPVPAGLLLHEALGHRLEGDRLLSAGEGQTFRDGLGREVLPTFLSLRDDPTLARFQGRSLVGHYRFDDEGVPAASAELVKNGKLCGFMTSRTCIGRRHESNGHARGYYHQRPNSRMAVTMVESARGLGDRAMKEALVAEIRRQKLPFGIRILEAYNGETSTESYNFQAFLGETCYATRVHADGREEPIRGVDFVGTPLNAVRGIIAAGDRLEVDNSYCGAESGYIPVSTISPALLLSQLELQSKSDSAFTQYVYPLPWAVNRRRARGGRRRAGNARRGARGRPRA